MKFKVGDYVRIIGKQSKISPNLGVIETKYHSKVVEIVSADYYLEYARYYVNFPEREYYPVFEDEIEYVKQEELL
jgi:hypothetical protein